MTNQTQLAEITARIFAQSASVMASPNHSAGVMLSGAEWQIVIAALRKAPDAQPDDVAVLREHIAEQITFAEMRIQDGIELGATVWRLALEDIASEARTALERTAP